MLLSVFSKRFVMPITALYLKVNINIVIIKMTLIKLDFILLKAHSSDYFKLLSMINRKTSCEPSYML